MTSETFNANVYRKIICYIANMNKVIPLHSCFFSSIFDLVGINMASFLPSSSSFSGILGFSSILREKSHWRDSLQGWFHKFIHIRQTILHFALQIEVFWDNDHIAWRCPEKQLIGWIRIPCHHADHKQRLLSNQQANKIGSLSFLPAIIKIQMGLLLHTSHKSLPFVSISIGKELPMTLL